MKKTLLSSEDTSQNGTESRKQSNRKIMSAITNETLLLFDDNGNRN